MLRNTSWFKKYSVFPYMVVVSAFFGSSIYSPQVLMGQPSESLEEKSFNSKIGGMHLSNNQNENNSSNIERYKSSDVKQVISLDRVYEKISELENLPYNNTEVYEWEKDVLISLETKFGSDSDCYQHFLNQTNLGFWRAGAIDRRTWEVTPELYQQEYEDQLQAYKVLLKKCLETIK